MHILVVGGTRFVGRHLVAGALGRGHRVTLLHRGRTGAGLFPEAGHLLGDRDAGPAELAALVAGRSWDATVDVCAYRPGQVSALATALDGRGGAHLFVSTVSVYAPPPGPGLTESSALLPPAGPEVSDVTDETYGPLKVACEQAAAAAYGDALLVIRPTYVVGPHDHTWRFPSWVRRLAAGGEVLCPGPDTLPMQVIDARDQAAFMLSLLERGVAGRFHTVSPRPPFSFADLLSAVADVVAPAGTTLTWVDGDFLGDADLSADALPLWERAPKDADVLAADPSAAYAAGLSPRPLADTVADTWDWVRVSAAQAPAGVGLTRTQEAELLATWRARG
jgi:2'-hydroxyisoflavone reductase